MGIELNATEEELNIILAQNSLRSDCKRTQLSTLLRADCSGSERGRSEGIMNTQPEMRLKGIGSERSEGEEIFGGICNLSAGGAYDA